ncbi:MAG: peroxidase family protein [Thiolinea sp.]
MFTNSINQLRSLSTNIDRTSRLSGQQAGFSSQSPAFGSSNINTLLTSMVLQMLIQLVQQLLSQLQQGHHGGQGQNGNNGNGNGNGNGNSNSNGNQGAEPEYRTIDGTGNNQQNTELGSTGQTYERLLDADTTRGIGGTTEATLSSAREISNAVATQTESTENRKGLSDMFWIWGQFLDHDITLSAESHGEKANIAVPEGDPWFDPFNTGTAEIGFTRSVSTVGTDGVSRQTNNITSFIDGSNVYGSDKETADSLRSFSGGKLLANEVGMMPKNDEGSYMGGDVRANENAGLTSMHTLWMREHNRVADELAQDNPEWTDEQLYQEARRTVIAEIQAVTYNEFLPLLLGEDALSKYDGYDPTVNPDITSSFATAAYRFGHTMISPTLLRLDEQGNEISEGNLSLREAFFKPENVTEAGIDPILRGAASQTAQAVDTQVIDDLRNFLFGPPGAGGLDLVSLNIQRGRDHELPGYNDAREQLGLPRIESFDDPIWKEGVGEKLAQVYDSPDDVDLWVAGLAENYVGDSMLGETSTTILKQQFESLRDGDRFWYENQFSGRELKELNSLTLSDIIQRNTEIENVQDNVMVASNIHQSVTV